jgi:hypothetical protein
MGASTLSGPLRVGTIREGAAANIGKVILSQTDTFAYTDAAKTLGIILPANSQIVSMVLMNETAWDSATSDVVEIGDGTDVDEFADGNLQTAGVSVVTVDAAQASVWDTIGTSDVTITVTITSAGGSLTVGASRLTVNYVQN